MSIEQAKYYRIGGGPGGIIRTVAPLRTAVPIVWKIGLTTNGEIRFFETDLVYDLYQIYD